jgi:hypothetical protein
LVEKRRISGREEGISNYPLFYSCLLYIDRIIDWNGLRGGVYKKERYNL